MPSLVGFTPRSRGAATDLRPARKFAIPPADPLSLLAQKFNWKYVVPEEEGRAADIQRRFDSIVFSAAPLGASRVGTGLGPGSECSSTARPPPQRIKRAQDVPVSKDIRGPKLSLLGRWIYKSRQEVTLGLCSVSVCLPFRGNVRGQPLSRSVELPPTAMCWSVLSCHVDRTAMKTCRRQRAEEPGRLLEAFQTYS